MRSQLWRLAGGTIGRKTNFGKRVRIDRPRCIVMGERVTVEDDVWFKIVAGTASIRIGAFSFIGRGSELDVSQRVLIGEHVLFGPGVFITDHNHNIASNARIDEQGCTASDVIIGDDVWLGARVVVLPGVTIGTGAVVGAGAVVTKSIPEYSVSVGVPARVLRRRARG